MRKFSSLLLLGALVASCSAPENKGYEISGTYADTIMNGKTLYLMSGDSIIDSTKVSGSTFTFKGETDTILVYRVAGKGVMRGVVRYNTLANVLLQKGAQVKINVDKGVNVTDNGGANQIWYQFINDYRTANDKEVAEYQKLISANASRDSLMLFVDGVRARLEKMWKEAVAKNCDNLAGAAIFSDFCYEVQDLTAFDSIYKSLKYAKLFPALSAQKKAFENLQATSAGKMFVDFGGKDLEGKSVKLSDYVGKGKYVLVDFWASWCGPCRGEIPNILKVYNKFKGDKFIVVGVDVWDKDTDFKKAVEEEKINYPQIFTEGKVATELYGINGIPQIMLFAPDGKIVKRNLRGDAIGEIVKESLKK